MQRLTKKEALDYWNALPAMDVRKPVPIPYKHTGSTYGADGIRIEGSREFIDSILAQLKTLLDCENGETRLAVNYQQVESKPGTPSKPGKPYTYHDNWVCYAKVHMRGDEARAVNAYASALGAKSIVSAGY